jgi:hypothetical protein
MPLSRPQGFDFRAVKHNLENYKKMMSCLASIYVVIALLLAAIAPTSSATVTLPYPNPHHARCVVCGYGKAVTIPYATVTLPNLGGFSGGTTTCRFLEQAGLDGYMNYTICQQVIYVLSPCGCKTSSTKFPTKRPTPRPTKRPTRRPTRRPV